MDVNIFSAQAARHKRGQPVEMSIGDYLDLCRQDPGAYSFASERMLKAIGEPKFIDTRHDARLSRLFANKTIKVYPAFAEFFGMEEPIEQGSTTLRLRN